MINPMGFLFRTDGVLDQNYTIMIHCYHTIHESYPSVKYYLKKYGDILPLFYIIMPGMI